MTNGQGSPAAEASSIDLDGRRILIVEDEVAISMLLEDMLTDLGAEIVGPAARLAPALAFAEGEPLDIAILDVNLAGETIYPVVEALARRGVPFIFSTGYGSAGITEPYRNRPVLQKPFSQAELERQIRTALVSP